MHKDHGAKLVTMFKTWHAYGSLATCPGSVVAVVTTLEHIGAFGKLHVMYYPCTYVL